MQEIELSKDYKLPSMGLIYDKPVDSVITLKGMNKKDIDIIKNNDIDVELLIKVVKNCLQSKLSIKVEDLAVNDFIFALVKIKSLTFGYNMDDISVCPHCKSLNKNLVNTTSLDYKTLDIKSLRHLETIYLAKLNKNITIRYTSVKMKNDLKNSDIKTYIKSHIKTIDKKNVSQDLIDEFIDSLSLFDLRLLSKQIEALDNSYGINPLYKVECGKCGREYKSFFDIYTNFKIDF